MGIYDSIIHINKQTAITPSPNHYDRGSFESSIILPKNNNLSKNFIFLIKYIKINNSV